MDYILIFINTHNALLCEKILKDVEIDVNILPTPSHISNSCGISIGISNNDFDKINDLILNNKIFVKFIYDLKNNCQI